MVQQLQQHAINAHDPARLISALQSWPLGPLDSLVAYQVPVAVVFIYESDTSQPAIDLTRLRTSLAHVLNYYPHLTGRLNVHPTTGVRHIDRLGTGAQLYEARLDKPLLAFKRDGQYSILDLPGAGNDLLAPFDSSFEGVRDGPILTVQHTVFSCGAVALGIRCSHVVTDGDGFFRLVGDLARIYREMNSSAGELSVDSIPYVKSYGVRRESKIAEYIEMDALSYESRLFSVDDQQGNNVPSTSDRPPPPVIGRELHFSSSDLTKIRHRAIDPSDPDARISTFVALSSYIYQQIHKARTILEKRDPDLYRMISSDFLTPINLRYTNRLPSLPRNYFPNGLLTHYTTVPPSTLACAPLHEIARQIQDMITTQCIFGSEAENTLQWIEAQPNKNHIQLGFRPGPGSFMISQWSAFDLYGPGSHFIEGRKPVLVSPPFTPISLIDGLAYILPPHPVNGEKGDGLVVYLSLVQDVWEVMDQESLFGLDNAL